MIYIIDCGSKKVKEIRKMVETLVEDWKIIPLSKVLTSVFTDAQAFIISGSPTLLTQSNEQDRATWIQSVQKLLTYQLPLLGICFGHQILGLAYGATYSLCKEDRLFQRVQQKRKDSLFNDLPYPTVSLKEDHTECIELPKDFILLASSSTCQVEAMKHQKMPWYGVQFHPETSGKYGIKLIENFLALIPPQEGEK